MGDAPRIEKTRRLPRRGAVPILTSTVTDADRLDLLPIRLFSARRGSPCSTCMPAPILAAGTPAAAILAAEPIAAGTRTASSLDSWLHGGCPCRGKLHLQCATEDIRANSLGEGRGPPALTLSAPVGVSLPAGDLHLLLLEKPRDRLVVELGQVVELHGVDPAVADLDLGDELLLDAQSGRHAAPTSRTTARHSKSSRPARSLDRALTRRREVGGGDPGGRPCRPGSAAAPPGHVADGGGRRRGGGRRGRRATARSGAERGRPRARAAPVQRSRGRPPPYRRSSP
jgi:hypothetical protein